MKKASKESGYLVLEGLVAFVLILSTISLYFPLLTTVLQRLQIEKVNVENNRRRYEQIQLGSDEVSEIQLKGIEWDEE
ncbi:hypothetical protein CYV26_10250 [Carnobacterium maltaromaticum]|uniref:hypothetical protein n=1 Tax=Carnobacterium maltaromaticum TaxID=2751 RepID=UPI000C756C34|nr:hypothetical protein [Carnobacterium maltaromaticum]PLS34797.1 hypothetical protein CYV33_10235 [Carnobacterium maltaromaticum]PLS36616.1 hypothetical protein CYV30_07870 [Carnobacterium maltaromaticum]PLS37431.1 hypothetical protein CYV31_07875 [Carnobacterium maltaromaticum]PLS43647.1 hypothetical protein CYV28_07885 [Carnobacterium maltaromaticum]PLS43991.1 hypothetical protein CYV27_10235 [Carnobacterium maltaromaticum]